MYVGTCLLVNAERTVYAIQHTVLFSIGILYIKSSKDLCLLIYNITEENIYICARRATYYVYRIQV